MIPDAVTTPTAARAQPSLTVVMPVYNEEGCVEDVVNEVRAFVLDRVADSELLAIDDGSTDRSPAILDALAVAHPAIHVVHKKNGGHGDALRCGLRHAAGDYLFLIDSDRQIPLSDFLSLWDRRAPNAIVCGMRTRRSDPLHRLILTRVVAASISLLFGRRLRDANAPFKVLPRSFWLRAEPLIPEGTLAPSLFLAVVAARDPAMRLVEVPVTHLPRKTGKTVLRPWRLFRFCARAFRQLLALRRDLRGR